MPGWLTERMLADFDAVIRAAIDHPGGDVGALLPSASGAVLRGADLPASEPLVDAIFTPATTRPDHIAVEAPGHSLSWSDVIERAEAIARELVVPWH